VSLLLTPIPSLLPIPSYLLSTIAQAQISQNRKGEAEKLFNQGIQQAEHSQYQDAILSWQQALVIYQELTDHNGEADSLYNMGNAYDSLGQYAKAIEFLEHSLSIYRIIPDRNGKANSLNVLGVVYNHQGQYAKAIEFLEHSLSIYRIIPDRNGEANSLTNLGTAYGSQGKYAKAIEFLEQSLSIQKDIDNHNGEANSLNNLGNAYSFQGKYAKAIEFLEQSLNIYRAIPNPKGEADSLNNLGNTYNLLGEYSKAIGFFRQSLDIYRVISDQNGQAYSLNNLGNTYNLLGEYSKAIEFFGQSFSISRTIDDQNGKAKSLTNLGISYNYQGQYAKGIKLFEQSLSIYKNIDDPKDEAASLTNLSNTYFALGQYKKAIEFSEKSLEIQKKLPDPDGEAGSRIALGNAHTELREYAEAIDSYQDSLSIERNIGNRKGEALSLNNLGKVYFYSLGQYAKAIDFFQQSLKIQRKISDLKGEGDSLNNLGIAYDFLGQYPKAIEFLQQSLSIFREIGNREGEGISLSNIGLLLEKQKHPELAIVFYKQSVNIREGIRQDLHQLTRELQESYTQTVADTYRSLADLLLSQGRVLEAQQVLELLKIQELRDFTKDTRAGGVTQGSPLNPSESRIVPPYDSLINLGLKLTKCERKPPYCSERDQLRTQRDIATQEFNQQAAKLIAVARQQRGKDPAQLAQEELTVAAQKVVTAQPKTILIYPLVLDDKLWLVWGSQAGKQGVVFSSKLVSVGPKELAKTVVELRQLLERPENEQKLQQVSQKLYQWLIAPLRAELDANGIQNLVFSLDRSTRYIPMAALFDGKQYLIQKFNISTILTAGLTDTKDHLLPNKESNPVLALGVSDAVSKFNALPHVKEEINAVVHTASNTKGIYPGMSLLNKDFTKDAFKYLIDYRILHIATHGQFVSGNPEDSFLLLGNGNQFKITEIKNLSDLGGIHLVVLSACETAQGGEDNDGIEVSGISYYFLTSGAKSVIASLWGVNDASTSELMRLFYQNLSTGKMSKTEALRQAQLTVIAGNKQSSDANRTSVHIEPVSSGSSASISRNLSHPYYWAPFILIGNGL